MLAHATDHCYYFRLVDVTRNSDDFVDGAVYSPRHWQTCKEEVLRVCNVFAYCWVVVQQQQPVAVETKIDSVESTAWEEAD